MVTDLDEETQEEKAAGQSDDPCFFLRREAETAVPYARRVFERVFCSDIERVLKMDVRSLSLRFTFITDAFDSKYIHLIYTQSTALLNLSNSTCLAHEPLMLMY